MNLTEERLALLRENAGIERDTELEYHARLGEDPADVIEIVPSIDEFIVFALRDELLEERGQFAEFALARLAARAKDADAAEHRVNADHAEFQVLREIAERVPELTTAVWSLAAHLDVPE